jgi:hypothetical protein
VSPRGLSKRTQESYVQAIRQLAEHYRKSPDSITEEELRQYFLYLKNVRKYAGSSLTIVLCGIKFFYEHTLNKDLPTLNFISPPEEKKLSVTFSVHPSMIVSREMCAPRSGEILIRGLVTITPWPSAPVSTDTKGYFLSMTPFFPYRLFESDPISPIIRVSDSLLFSMFGKEAGSHRLF